MTGLKKRNIKKMLKLGAKVGGAYIMGHAHIDVTMDVYNHVSEMSRIESEITRLENVTIS